MMPDRFGRLGALWFGTGLLAAAFLNWQFRYNAAGDTVNYLDVASKYAHGRVADAVVLYWSPGYAWLLAPLTFLPRALHLPAAHVLQTLLVMAALAATWRLTQSLRSAGADISDQEIVLILGAALTSALVVTPARYVTPDVAALALVVWLAARVISETTSERQPVVERVGTGALWGAAYLVRTYAAAYGGIVVLIASVIMDRPKPAASRIRWLAPYVVGFLLIGGPWIAALSVREGRFTWGESGTNNLLAALERDTVLAPAWPRILASGRVHDFERRFPAAVPESYDVDPGGTYRYHHVAGTYARILAGNVEALFFGFYPPDLPLFWPLGLLGVLAWIVFRDPDRGRSAAARAGPAALLALGGIGIAMFVAIHVESRYVAPFIVLIAAAIAWRSSQQPSADRHLQRTLLASVGVLFWTFPFFVAADSLRSSRAPGARSLDPDAEWLASHGTRYAVVGPTYDLGMAAWVSDTQLIASVKIADATIAECASIEGTLRSMHVDAVLSPRGAVECGPWQSARGSNLAVWTIGSQPAR